MSSHPVTVVFQRSSARLSVEKRSGRKFFRCNTIVICKLLVDIESQSFRVSLVNVADVLVVVYIVDILEMANIASAY